MTVALIVVAVLLSIAAGGSAVMKLRKDPRVLESLHSVGVTDTQVPILAILELLGVLGLIVGIWVPALGVAAAAALTLYFLGAVVAHLRVKAPVKEAVPPGVIMLLGVLTTLLELAR